MKNKTIVSVSILAATLSWSVAANATLIDRGNGMIYDSNQNLTWLQDTNYAKTSGYDDDGLMGWDDAMAWASDLTYGGHDDWRLPKLNADLYHYPSLEGVFFIGGSEVEVALMGSPCPIIVNNTGTDFFVCLYPLPFTNLNTSPFWFSTEEGNTAWAGKDFIFTPVALHPKSDQLQAWAVRDGDVASIPEPQSLALVALGLACMGYSMRKPRIS